MLGAPTIRPLQQPKQKRAELQSCRPAAPHIAPPLPECRAGCPRRRKDGGKEERERRIPAGSAHLMEPNERWRDAIGTIEEVERWGVDNNSKGLVLRSWRRGRICGRKRERQEQRVKRETGGSVLGEREG